MAIFIISFSLIPIDLFCFSKKNFPASTSTFLGTSPISSDPVTLNPLELALSQVLSKTSCSGEVLISVKLYEICAIPYSLIYQPIPLTDLNNPGVLSGFPSLSFMIFPDNTFPSLLILPASLISNATALAFLVEVVLRLIL
jgi:hypothetical protein